MNLHFDVDISMHTQAYYEEQTMIGVQLFPRDYHVSEIMI